MDALCIAALVLSIANSVVLVLAPTVRFAISRRFLVLIGRRPRSNRDAVAGVIRGLHRRRP